MSTHNICFCREIKKMIPKLSNEPCHKIMALFVFRKLVLQTHMRSHPVGLDVWFLVEPFVYFHTTCVRAAKAMARLRECKGSPEPLLFACVIGTIISWAGSAQIIPKLSNTHFICFSQYDVCYRLVSPWYFIIKQNYTVTIVLIYVLIKIPLWNKPYWTSIILNWNSYLWYNNSSN